MIEPPLAKHTICKRVEFKDVEHNISFKMAGLISISFFLCKYTLFRGWLLYGRVLYYVTLNMGGLLLI